MPRDHARVLVRIWADEDWTALSMNAQRRYHLLLSQERVNAAGVQDLRLQRWSQGARDDSLEQVKADLNELHEHRFIVVDTTTEEVLLRSYMRNDEVWKIPNSMKSALTAAQQIQSRHLRTVLVGELRRLVDLIPEGRVDKKSNRDAVTAVADLLEQSLAKGSGNPSAKGYRKGSANPYPNPSNLGPFRQAKNTRSNTVSEPLPEGLTEPLAEPLPEPLGIGVGVGDSLTSAGTTSSKSASRAPTGPPTNAGEVVAAWVEAFEVNGARPSGGMRNQVGRLARELLGAGNDPAKVLAAARAAGTKGFATIDRELGAMTGRGRLKAVGDEDWRRYSEQ